MIANDGAVLMTIAMLMSVGFVWDSKDQREAIVVTIAIISFVKIWI